MTESNNVGQNFDLSILKRIVDKNNDNKIDNKERKLFNYSETLQGMYDALVSGDNDSYEDLVEQYETVSSEMEEYIEEYESADLDKDGQLSKEELYAKFNVGNYKHLEIKGDSQNIFSIEDFIAMDKLFSSDQFARLEYEEKESGFVVSSSTSNKDSVKYLKDVNKVFDMQNSKNISDEIELPSRVEEPVVTKYALPPIVEEPVISPAPQDVNMTITELFEKINLNGDNEVTEDEIKNAYNTTSDTELKYLLSFFTDGNDISDAFKIAAAGYQVESFNDWNKGITLGTNDVELIAKDGVISNETLAMLKIASELYGDESKRSTLGEYIDTIVNYSRLDGGVSEAVKAKLDEINNAGDSSAVTNLKAELFGLMKQEIEASRVPDGGSLSPAQQSSFDNVASIINNNRTHTTNYFAAGQVDSDEQLDSSKINNATFDNNNRLIGFTTGNETYTISYSDNGEMVVTHTVGDTGKTFVDTYSADNKIKSSVLSENGTVKSTKNFTYFASGNLKEIVTNETIDGNQVKTEDRYYENGVQERLKVSTTRPDGAKSTIEDKYKQDGTLFERIHERFDGWNAGDNPDVYYRTVEKIGANGKVESSVISEDGNVVATKNYSYFDSGNLREIVTNETIDGNQVKTEDRYYENGVQERLKVSTTRPDGAKSTIEDKYKQDGTLFERIHERFDGWNAGDNPDDYYRTVEKFVAGNPNPVEIEESTNWDESTKVVKKDLVYNENGELIEWVSNTADGKFLEANMTISNTPKTITIEGVQYQVSCNGSQQLNLKKDGDEIVLTGSRITLTAVSNDTSAVASTIRVKGDSNNINLGNGNDKVFIEGSSNKVNGGAGNDDITIVSGRGNKVSGGAGDDKITLGEDVYHSTIHGDEGNDEINLSKDSFQNTVYGDGGDDKINAQHSYQNKIYTGEGKNEVILDDSFQNDVITGSDNSENKITSQDSWQNDIFAISGENEIILNNSWQTDIFTGEHTVSFVNGSSVTSEIVEYTGEYASEVNAYLDMYPDATEVPLADGRTLYLNSDKTLRYIL